MLTHFEDVNDMDRAEKRPVFAVMRLDQSLRMVINITGLVYVSQLDQIT